MKYQFIDIHAHTNFTGYDVDREEVIHRALDAGVAIINVGTDKETSASAVALAHKYEDGIYATVAVHPVHTSETFDLEYYRKLAQDPKVVAIGECGLDYFHLDAGSIALQKEVFLAHIKLANEVGKPLMLHIRNGKDASATVPNAYGDAYEMLKAHAKVKGNVHFFAGTWTEAQKFFELGFTISFTGVITFAREYAEVIKRAPLDMIMSETDCPYVSPAPYRGKRNEPAHVREVVRKIAEIRGEDFEIVRAQLLGNAKRVFGLSLE